jgi:stalled ribosome rescue protein Dom34
MKKKWDKIQLKRIDDSSDITKNAEVAAIILEEGI